MPAHFDRNSKNVLIHVWNVSFYMVYFRDKIEAVEKSKLKLQPNKSDNVRNNIHTRGHVHVYLPEGDIFPGPDSKE